MTAPPDRRPRKLLTAEQKYDLPEFKWSSQHLFFGGGWLHVQARASVGGSGDAREGVVATLGWVHWWNTRRIHSYLDALSPDQFEAAHDANRTDHTDKKNLNIHPAQNPGCIRATHLHVQEAAGCERRADHPHDDTGDHRDDHHGRELIGRDHE